MNNKLYLFNASAIASAGEKVFYTGNISQVYDGFARFLMKKYLISGNWYEIKRVQLDRNYYLIESIWCSCKCFERNLKKFMEERYRF